MSPAAAARNEHANPRKPPDRAVATFLDGDAASDGDALFRWQERRWQRLSAAVTIAASWRRIAKIRAVVAVVIMLRMAASCASRGWRERNVAKTTQSWPAETIPPAVHYSTLTCLSGHVKQCTPHAPREEYTTRLHSGTPLGTHHRPKGSRSWAKNVA